MLILQHSFLHSFVFFYRFDLIFLVLDPQDEAFDRRLARHLVSLYYKTTQRDEEVLDLSILRDYIAYAKEHVHPKLSEEASQKLIQVYVDMRKIGAGRGRISAYPRQLESLIRLAEAHAKVRFSNVVTVDDVDEAWRYDNFFLVYYIKIRLLL